MFAAYKQGCQPSGPEVGALVATPGFLLDQMTRLRGEVTAVGKEIQTAWSKANCTPIMKGDDFCGRLNQFIENTWSPFVFEFENFRLRHQHWYQRLWGNLFDEIQSYRKRLRVLYDQAKALAVPFTTPKPAAPEVSSFGAVASFLKIMGLMVLGGFAIWALAQIFGGYGARALSPGV